jgi:hypothetical protein
MGRMAMVVVPVVAAPCELSNLGVVVHVVVVDVGLVAVVVPYM